jgi:mannose-6-phosphate isomerase-like protein (cupin superfamily)
VELTQPLPEEELAKLTRVTPEQMRARLTTPEDLVWSSRAFLCSGQDRGNAELALVIGYGLTEDRTMHPRVFNPHGFSMAWLRAEPGEGLLTHRHDAAQVYMVKDGHWRITLNRENPVTTEIGPLDTFSVPIGAWQSIENIGDDTGLIVAMTGGDGRVRLDWTEATRDAALAAGTAHDPDGYLAPAAVVAA